MLAQHRLRCCMARVLCQPEYAQKILALQSAEQSAPISIQEAVPLSAANVVLGGGTENAARWDAAIAQVLNGELERSHQHTPQPSAELDEAASPDAQVEGLPPGESGSASPSEPPRATPSSADIVDGAAQALSPRGSRRFLSPALSSEGSEYMSGDEALDVSIDGDPSVFVQVHWGEIIRADQFADVCFQSKYVLN